MCGIWVCLFEGIRKGQLDQRRVVGEAGEKWRVLGGCAESEGDFVVKRRAVNCFQELFCQVMCDLFDGHRHGSSFGTCSERQV